MFHFIKSLFFPEHFPGIIIGDLKKDDRSNIIDEREVIVSAGPLTWEEKKQSEWRRFPIRDQKNSYSCGAHVGAKLLGIEQFLEEGEYVEFSPRDIYSQRLNNPQEGMFVDDIMRICYTKGATLELLMPTDPKEELMNIAKRQPSDVRVAEIFKAGGEVVIKDRSIDNIAKVIHEQGKGVGLLVKFDYDEWTSVPEVKRPMPKYAHFVTAVDFTLHEGEKAIIIDDSWGLHRTALNGQRILTESYLKQRLFDARYLLSFKNDGSEAGKIKYLFNSRMALGETSRDIEALQTVLQKEKLFPSNIVPTGYYGKITTDAVVRFRKKYNLPLTDGKKVDEEMLSLLNKIYA